MAANIGSQPWLTRPLSPQPHTRHKRRALRLLLERFRFAHPPTAFLKHTGFFLKNTHKLTYVRGIGVVCR